MMAEAAYERLEDVLGDWARAAPDRGPVAETVIALADAGRRIAALVGRGPLAGRLGAVRRASDTGDDQKELDVRAEAILLSALAGAPVALFGSEESETVEVLRPDAPLAVAVDPLDGSSNIDTNVSVGTIFSVLPAGPDGLLAPGRAQRAAGYVLYGPQTAMVLTVGDGVDVFTLDPEDGAFRRTARRLAVPPRATEFAINASNYRHWEPVVRAYVDDCLAGAEGPRGRDFNMRWIASMVAEAHRILTRGGVYLYPADARRGYAAGRLRLVYEANPIGFLMEQAGGRASTGCAPILDRRPESLHERVPLVFGSADEVDRFERLAGDPPNAPSPLFAERGLLRV